MRVIVTGGAGNLGTVVLRRLAADRRVRSLVCVDLRPPIVASAKLEHVIADIRSQDLVDHFARADVVVHLAYVLFSDDSKQEIESINIEGSHNVFRAAVACGATRLVYSSSIAAYGVVPGHPTPIVEDTPRRHQTSFGYASTKFRVEALLDELEQEHPELDVVRLRPAICIGKHQMHPLGRAMIRGIMPEAGAPVLPLVWDEDVADAVRLATRFEGSAAFNIAASDPISASELARATGLRCVRIPAPAIDGIARLAPVLARLGLGPRVSREWIDSRAAPMIVSAARARAQLGWRPSCSTCVDVIRRFVEVVPSRTDARIAAFMKLVDFFGRKGGAERELGRGSMNLHVALTGPGGGDYTIATKAGVVRARPGIPRPPTSVISIPAADFITLLAGREEFATAMLTGKIRVEGQGHATMLIGAMVARFRSVTRRSDARGSVARLLSKWFEGRAAA